MYETGSSLFKRRKGKYRRYGRFGGCSGGGKLSGAGIDVADPEPLPSSSRLWNCPNVIITPHVSGGFHLSVTLDRIVEISAKNMRAFLGDGEYVSLVDRKTGYKKTETGE